MLTFVNLLPQSVDKFNTWCVANIFFFISGIPTHDLVVCGLPPGENNLTAAAPQGRLAR
jgi:hypothetical protein